MDVNYTSDEFRADLISGLRKIKDKEGPYLVHCLEGKDRTGFVCMLLEALAGASYDEIIDDYMETYANYYGITRETKPEKYAAIKENNIDYMLRFIAGGEETDPAKEDLKSASEKYLKDGGMEDEEIKLIQEKLCRMQ